MTIYRWQTENFIKFSPQFKKQIKGVFNQNRTAVLHVSNKELIIAKEGNHSDALQRILSNIMTYIEEVLNSSQVSPNAILHVDVILGNLVNHVWRKLMKYFCKKDRYITTVYHKQ